MLPLSGCSPVPPTRETYGGLRPYCTPFRAWAQIGTVTPMVAAAQRHHSPVFPKRPFPHDAAWAELQNLTNRSGLLPEFPGPGDNLRVGVIDT
jgi:hypothetical protein